MVINCRADMVQVTLSVATVGAAGLTRALQNPVPMRELFSLMGGGEATARGAAGIIAVVPSAGMDIGGRFGQPTGSTIEITGGGAAGQFIQGLIDIGSLTPVGSLITSGIEAAHSCRVAF